jgi:DNA-binding transcriptional regulator YhcF (GntR family)
MIDEVSEKIAEEISKMSDKEFEKNIKKLEKLGVNKKKIKELIRKKLRGGDKK